MNNITLNVRTSSIVSPYREISNGNGGTFGQIMLSAACRRDYKDRNGDFPTDFFLLKATGPMAKIIHDNCTETEENGKLISRHLLITGRIETYSKLVDKTVKKQFKTITGIREFDVPVQYETTNTVIVIRGLTFLDSRAKGVLNNTTNKDEVLDLTELTASTIQNNTEDNLIEVINDTSMPEITEEQMGQLPF